MILLLTAFLTWNVNAEIRETTTMDCASARESVVERGVVYLNTRDLVRRRYVKDESWCLGDEVAAPAFVPTREKRRCFVGYVCVRD